MTNPKDKDRDILSNEEIDAMFEKADEQKTEFFRLRAKCLVSLAKKFGKRRIEMARLARKDIERVDDDLEFTFTLAKKRKKGFFQYLKFLEKQVKKGAVDSNVLSKSLPELQTAWKEWQLTTEGQKVKNETSLQSISTEDKYARHIMEYLGFLDRHYPTAKFLFPSGVCFFGGIYIIDENEHLSGSQLLRIIKPLNPSAWLHLFRETLGGTIAKAHGRNLDSIYEVKDSLDLEREETAYRYVRRYAAKKQPIET